MGIDAMDVAFRLERRFGITIAKDEAIFLFCSPRMVAWLVTEKLQGRNPPVPDFQWLYRKMIETLRVTPGTKQRWFYHASIDSYFPRDTQPECWSEFERLLQIPLPPLEYRAGFLGPYLRRSLPEVACWIIEHHPELVPIKRAGSAVEMPDGHEQWTEETIWSEVVVQLSDALGVDHDAIKPDSTMVSELGME